MTRDWRTDRAASVSRTKVHRYDFDYALPRR
jgi:hypothetical protein